MQTKTATYLLEVGSNGATLASYDAAAMRSQAETNYDLLHDELTAVLKEGYNIKEREALVGTVRRLLAELQSANGAATDLRRNDDHKRQTIDEARRVLGVKPGEFLTDAAFRILRERDEARQLAESRHVEARRSLELANEAHVARRVAQATLKAASEALGLQDGETALDAARRVVRERNEPTMEWFSEMRRMLDVRPGEALDAAARRTVRAALYWKEKAMAAETEWTTAATRADIAERLANHAERRADAFEACADIFKRRLEAVEQTLDNQDRVARDREHLLVRRLEAVDTPDWLEKRGCISPEKADK